MYYTSIIPRSQENSNDSSNKIPYSLPSPNCLELTFENPNEAPFAYIKEIAVSDYMVLDETTGEILNLESYPEYSGKGTINDGKAVVNLSIDDTKLKSGEEYTIVIEKMYGLSKADAPLHITGRWECEFIG